MKAIRYLLVIPASVIGFLMSTFFIGIIPTIMVNSFFVDFHYSETALWWVRMCGRFGTFAGIAVCVICVAVWNKSETEDD